jgi:hypothetical protein
VKLREVAFSRSGDKGDTSNLSVVALAERDYAWLARHVSAARGEDHLGARACGGVVRYELPTLGALNFVVQSALGGGVTRSLFLDAHGKTLSSLLLELELPDAGEQERRSEPGS